VPRGLSRTDEYVATTIIALDGNGAAITCAVVRSFPVVVPIAIAVPVIAIPIPIVPVIADIDINAGRLEPQPPEQMQAPQPAAPSRQPS